MLGLLGGLLEPLQSHAVLPQVDAVGLAELVRDGSISRWSKSSPPRYVLPLVERTVNTPRDSSRIEMSNVPPPRS